MPTKLIRSLGAIASAQKGAVLTIGNFDGVHLGHQQLAARAIEKARMLDAPALAVTFEPHPFEFFNRDNITIPRLTRFREKFTALAACGFDHILILKFNQELANISASDFIDRLVASLHPKHLVIGDDFHFGKSRQGNFELLAKMGAEAGFTVEAMPTFLVAGERVSSTRVRQALAAGDHDLARQLLGHPYTMQGRVRKGDQRGRQWGFPTANIFLHRALTPVTGVYTVYMHGIADKPLPGVANVGVRPTVDGTRSLLEVHLFNFNQEIYGRYVEVEFCEKLRDEIRYSNIDLLKAQISKDVTSARQYFQEQGVL